MKRDIALKFFKARGSHEGSYQQPRKPIVVPFPNITTSGTNFSLLFFGEHPLHKIRTFTAFRNCSERYLDPQRVRSTETRRGAGSKARRIDETQEERPAIYAAERDRQIRILWCAS